MIALQEQSFNLRNTDVKTNHTILKKEIFLLPNIDHNMALYSSGNFPD
jgi:hypothetical protein